MFNWTVSKGIICPGVIPVIWKLRNAANAVDPSLGPGMGFIKTFNMWFLIPFIIRNVPYILRNVLYSVLMSPMIWHFSFFKRWRFHTILIYFLVTRNMKSIYIYHMFCRLCSDISLCHKLIYDIRGMSERWLLIGWNESLITKIIIVN